MSFVTGNERNATLTGRIRIALCVATAIALSVFATDTATPASAHTIDATTALLRDVTPADIVTTMSAPRAPRMVLTRVKSGLASWYGDMWQGKKTASGRTFDMNELTAAHNSLPFGSKVKVTDLRNKRSVIVTITDRGDLEGRVIDLSLAAAKQLHMVDAGVHPVQLELVTTKN